MSANADLLSRRTAAVPRGVATATPIFAARAENAELWDADGNRYVDFAGGIAVLNTGHRHPKVLAAVRDQLDAYTHTAFQVVAYEPYVALAERLNALAPFDGPAKTILFTTGAEAVENAVKIARAATGRSAVIAFTGGFHGRTMLTMAMTGKVAPYKRLFGPLPAEVFHAPFPIPQYGVSVADSLRALDFLFRADVEPERVAAIVLEPVQGEGGFQPAPPELLRALRDICDRHGILLISDEVQAGFGRTGEAMWGFQRHGLVPDIVTMGKPMGAGHPMAAVVLQPEVIAAFGARVRYFNTFGGNPVSCAVGMAVLDVIENEGLMANALTTGRRLREGLEALARQYPALGATRGVGLFFGVDIVRDGAPDAAEATRIVNGLRDRRVLISATGPNANVLKIRPPLVFGPEHADLFLTALGEALSRS
ncbi:MAG TPA: aspartate aminotransferase family protein [Caulobacter sp.]|nr:aspartate aminotransferase family protein [Caulobacter sp.]